MVYYNIIRADDGYESTGILVGQFLTRRKLRAPVINAAAATKVIIID